MCVYLQNQHQDAENHLQYFMGNSQNIILLKKYSTQDNHVNRNNYHNNIHHYTDSCKDSINTAFAWWTWGYLQHEHIYLNSFLLCRWCFSSCSCPYMSCHSRAPFFFCSIIMFISRLVFLDSNTAAFHNSQLEAFFWILLYMLSHGAA